MKSKKYLILINSSYDKNKLDKNAKKIDKFLLRFLKKQKNTLLVNLMKYGVISGKKLDYNNFRYW